MADPLEKLFIKYKDSVYRFFFRSTMNAHKAEELTQDTFLQAFKGIGQFRGDSSLKTWLFTIARNIYLNDVKKKSNQLEHQVDHTEMDWPDAHNHYEAVHEQQLIQRVLSQLKEEERTYILLRDFQDFTYSEIASILNQNEGKVKIGIYRARKKFKRLYQSQEEGI
ncbi:sigma-70 family RNA polymerase sigma factor [Gracilibacillus sp. YIM 98692]|uniref:RNA polymerase sigma factor n=1 Tax=Gracilibacillus sp. YIM 98692 TaxID=2663532 RepID=UPI0013D0547B|nr:sigma-70 family RNA polymerase sigma factor [Gracilibacillus sp. YIM 98692]